MFLKLVDMDNYHKFKFTSRQSYQLDYHFRSLQSAKTFAVKYGISNAIEGYEALAGFAEVNVVYVGAINIAHLSIVKVTY